MFSVAPTTPSTRTGARSSASAAIASITAAPPHMSNFISSIFAERLQPDPAGVERDAPCRPAPAAVRVASGAVVGDPDQPRVLAGALRDRGERPHPGAADLSPRPASSPRRRRSRSARRARRTRRAPRASGRWRACCRDRAPGSARSAIVAAVRDRRAEVVVGAEDQLVQLRAPRRRRVASAPVAIEAVVAQQRALDEPGDDLIADVMGNLPAQRARRAAPGPAPAASPAA